MKTRILTLLTAFFISTCVFSQIPNSGFENWTGGYPDGWTANNSIPTLAPITQTSDAHSGASALKGEVFSYMSAAVPPNVHPTSASNLGYPMTSKYAYFNFWYKSDLFATDIGRVNVTVYRASGLSVGFGYLYLPASTVYIPCSVHIDYTTNQSVATEDVSFTMVDSVGAGFHLGSNFIIDDLSVSNTPISTTSIRNLEIHPFTVCPNPVNDKINVIGDLKTASAYQEQLFDVTGKLVKDASIISNEGSLPPLDVSTLPEGNYLLLISDQTNSVSERVFINRK